ncbi:MAG: Ig domain protein group 2 domain protein, partial [Acidobacteriaceae bacterium]|nr:Ig domain protein group 2 domain protein [Acidobacteriaceae bacterium]
MKKLNLLFALIFLCGFSVFSSATAVQITSPVSGSTVSSPVTINAQANPGPKITGWWVYVDNVGVYSTGATPRISPSISMSGGTHNVIVRAWSSGGSYASANLTLTVPTSTPTPTPISVSVSPSSAALQTGKSGQFSASVSGSTNTAVTWLVNGTQGGNSTVGTISSTGLYTAPAAVPSGSSVTITAKSVADASKSANATVIISAAPAAVSVSISPTSASLQSGLSKQFAATVTGTTNTATTWKVAGVTGGNSTVGTISTTGLYTAPSTVPSGGIETVTVTSTYDPTASANAAVTITASPVSVSISPTNATLQPSQSKQFTAAVVGSTNTAVNWLVAGIQGGNLTVGTVSTTGLYVAPSRAPANPVNVTAQSVAYSSASASATVTIQQVSTANQYWISTSGSDGNPGSQASQWATIAHANAALVLGTSGTVVHVASGTYNGCIVTTRTGTATQR